MAEKKKRIALQILLTEDEKQAVKDAAWRARMTATDFTKMALKQAIEQMERGEKS